VKFNILRLPYYLSILGPLSLLGQGQCPTYIFGRIVPYNYYCCCFLPNQSYKFLIKKKKKKIYLTFSLKRLLVVPIIVFLYYASYSKDYTCLNLSTSGIYISGHVVYV